jgi:hypothetical protein
MLLDGSRPSRTSGWVPYVAPVVTQAAGAGHWAAGRRQRALAEWAGAAGFGLVAWGLAMEAPNAVHGILRAARAVLRRRPRMAVGSALVAVGSVARLRAAAAEPLR